MVAAPAIGGCGGPAGEPRVATAGGTPTAVLAAHQDLPDTVGASVQTGAWFNAATFAYPTVVLDTLPRNVSGCPAQALAAV